MLFLVFMLLLLVVLLVLLYLRVSQDRRVKNARAELPGKVSNITPTNLQSYNIRRFCNPASVMCARLQNRCIQKREKKKSSKTKINQT